MTNKEIIKALDELDLSSYPYDEVKRLVCLFQPKVLRLTITTGAIIERIRPDVNVYERKDVSYRPADKNVKPQRATLPKKTAFYGTICHESDPLYNNRYMALLEASELLKAGKDAEGTEQYTLSRWFTNDPIRLAVFVHDTVYPDVYNNVLLDMAKREFERSRKSFVDAIQFDDYEKYVTEQFAKPVVPPHDYEYIISATIADLLMHANQLDGVMYPSVPSLGEFGMNVALRKDVADDKMVLQEVNELEYKQKGGEGRFSFIKKAIPDEMDNHGLKKWHYMNYYE